MKIEFNTNFKKQFAKLPLLRNHSVHSISTNARSINITGDYRAIYEKNEHRTLFTHIGTHSKLYE